MKSSIIISSTESIEGMKIEKYFDLISTNVVVGTNLFSDIGASFTDFFGGISDTYQNKLEKINKVGLDKLKQKAQNLGANGIVGVRLDFDEISGNGKSMFMLSTSGMAVKLRQLEVSKISSSEAGTHTVLPEDLEIQVNKIKITRKIKNKVAPSQEEWDFLLENPLEEILNDLIEIYLTVFKVGPTAVNEYQKSLRNYFSQFLKNLNEDIVSQSLYSRISENTVVISTLIQESKVFSSSRTLQLLDNGDPHIVVSILDSNKRIYSIEDLNIMKSILDRLDNLPNTGKIEIVKTLLGSTKEKFICEKNHQNDVNVKFCETEYCDRNIKGLTKSEINKINEFKIKTESLEALLS